MDGPKATVYFRDLAGARPEDAIKKTNTGILPFQEA